MSDLFFWLFLALIISAKKPEIKENSDDVHWNVWTICGLSWFLKNYKASSDIFFHKVVCPK